MLESSTNYVYKSIAVSADDNPHILSGNIAHRGVDLLWKRTTDDFVTPLENIEPDRIVGIRCDLDNCDPLFILSVYLPSSNIDEFKEYLDFLWALYDSLSDKGQSNCDGPLDTYISDCGRHKLQLHYAIYRLRFYSNSLIHILPLSNSHYNVASAQKNRGDKSHRVIVAISYNYTMQFIGYDSIQTR